MLLITHQLNWTAGWWLLLACFASGAILGLGFHKPNFMGGYASLRRRMARLGHIAFGALGILNLMFALSPWPAAGTTAGDVASVAFLVGALAMPAICFLTAWREHFRHLFFIPVTSLFAGVTITAVSGGFQ